MTIAHVLQLIMNVPFTAIHFATYESCKKLLALQEDESLAVQLAAGGTAGGVSAAATTPLDVVKTRLQLEGVNSATRYKSTAMVSCSYIMMCVPHRQEYGMYMQCVAHADMQILMLLNICTDCCSFNTVVNSTSLQIASTCKQDRYCW